MFVVLECDGFGRVVAGAYGPFDSTEAAAFGKFACERYGWQAFVIYAIHSVGEEFREWLKLSRLSGGR